MAEAEKSWNRRTAEYLAGNDKELVVGIEAALEAAGELRAAKCKILLARCYEIIVESRLSETNVRGDENLEDAILKAIQ